MENYGVKKQIPKPLTNEVHRVVPEVVQIDDDDENPKEIPNTPESDRITPVMSTQRSFLNSKLPSHSLSLKRRREPENETRVVVASTLDAGLRGTTLPLSFPNCRRNVLGLREFPEAKEKTLTEGKATSTPAMDQAAVQTQARNRIHEGNSVGCEGSESAANRLDLDQISPDACYDSRDQGSSLPRPASMSL